MSGAQLELATAAGRFAAVDHGGRGPDCLLIHGTGQNAVAWQACAPLLAERFRVVAFDLRGHGRTREDSSNAEQYWRDLGPIAAALRMESPLLIGHSTGAYAASAYVAAGGQAAGVVCVDGFTLDSASTLAAAATAATALPALRSLFRMFRYGWRASRADRDAYLSKVVQDAPRDWLNCDIEPELLRAMLERCFVEERGVWLRRPTLAEIAVVSAPGAERGGHALQRGVREDRRAAAARLGAARASGRSVRRAASARGSGCSPHAGLDRRLAQRAVTAARGARAADLAARVS
jgi:pimeloyl-ACP methyl ester carboxylesterase